MRSCVLASWVFGAVAAAGRAPHGEGRRLDDGGELARWKLQRHAPSPPLRWAQSELRFMQHHMFYDAEHKLVMCMIPKVACTEWMRMILRLKGDARWRMEPHFLSNKPLVSQLPIENATHIMNDPSWTKAVFFRDPAERLLSAYLDKFVQHNSYSSRVFSRPRMSFRDFVDEVASANWDHREPSGLHAKVNPHWKPQRLMCELDKFLPAYNFVGSYAHVGAHSRALLEALGDGVWAEAGASGWGTPAKLTFSMARAHNIVRKAPTNLTGDADVFLSSNTANHKTKSHEMMAKFYDAELLARVRRAYAMDYEMFEAIGLDATASSAAPRDGAAWADAASHSRVTHEGRFTTWTGLERMKNRPPDLEEKSLRQLMLEAKEKDANKPPEAKSSGGPGSGGLRSRKNRDARRRRYRGRRA